MTKLEAQKSKPQRKWKAGTKYKCIKSESCGYTKGKEYTAYKNSDGHVCLKADDGFEDICTMLVSGFVEASQ